MGSWKDVIMKNRWSRTVAVAVAVAALAGMLSGCAWSVGGEHQGGKSVHPTRGQELIDLQHARDQGAISEPEYQIQKQRILDR